jgi:hypothetical protein
MAQSTDPRPPEPTDVTDEQRRTVALTLASVAERYEGEDPAAPVDDFEFVVLVGVDAYALTGLGVRGGPKRTARIVRDLVGDVTGMTRGDLLAKLRELVAEWDGSEPAVMREGSGIVPAPRRGDVGEVSR